MVFTSLLCNFAGQLDNTVNMQKKRVIRLQAPVVVSVKIQEVALHKRINVQLVLWLI